MPGDSIGDLLHLNVGLGVAWKFVELRVRRCTWRRWRIEALGGSVRLRNLHGLPEEQICFFLRQNTKLRLVWLRVLPDREVLQVRGGIPGLEHRLDDTMDETLAFRPHLLLDTIIFAHIWRVRPCQQLLPVLREDLVDGQAVEVEGLHNHALPHFIHRLPLFNSKMKSNALLSNK